MIFSMTLLGWLMRLIVRQFWHCYRLPLLGSVMTKDWVHGVSLSSVCQTLLQNVTRAMITSSPPAWTSSAGSLSTPADFPFFNECTAASISLRRMEWSSSVCVWGQFSTNGSPLALRVYSSEQYSVHRFGSCYSSVRHFPERSLTVVAFPFFTVVRFSRVGMPSFCCSPSDFRQSHYTVLLSSTAVGSCGRRNQSPIC